MMKKDIQLIDRGRGIQLSTSRVTVLDLVPYFQEECPYEEIIRWIPTLSREEITVVDRYYHENKQSLDEEDRLIREQNALAKNPPQADRILRAGKAKLHALGERLQRARDNGEPK